MDITKEQSLNIRGLTILLAVIHNYVFRLMGINCNEFLFSQDYIDHFLAHVFSLQFPWYMVSFAVWPLVACFFFLSGYGLTKKYGDGTLNKGKYIKSHLYKLWVLFIPVYVVYVVLFYGVFGHPWNLPSILAQLTLTVNPLCYGENIFVIEPGIYWFLGVIFQLYLLFLVFRRLKRSWLWVLMGAFIVIHYLVLYLTNNDVLMWCRINAIGWGAPFLLGMIAAKTPLNLSKRQNAIVCILSAAMMFLCVTNKCLVPLSEISGVILGVSLSRIVRLKVLAWLGGISASIYVVHPLLKMVFYEMEPNSIHLSMAVYFVLSIALSWLYSLLVKALSPNKSK